MYNTLPMAISQSLLLYCTSTTIKCTTVKSTISGVLSTVHYCTSTIQLLYNYWTSMCVRKRTVALLYGRPQVALLEHGDRRDAR